MNSEELPNWVRKSLKILIYTFGDQKFTIKDAEHALEETDLKTIRIIFSHLSKKRLIKSFPSAEDSRRRIYALCSPEFPCIADRQLISSTTKFLATKKEGFFPDTSIKNNNEMLRDTNAHSAKLIQTASCQFKPQQKNINGYIHPFLSFAHEIVRYPQDLELIVEFLWLKKIRDCEDVLEHFQFESIFIPDSREFFSFIRMVNIQRERPDREQLLRSFSFEDFTLRFRTLIDKEGQYGRKYIEPTFAVFFNGPKNTDDNNLHDGGISPDELFSQFAAISQRFSISGMIISPWIRELIVKIANPKGSEKIYNPACGYGELLYETEKYLAQKASTRPHLLAGEAFVSTIARHGAPAPHISAMMADLLNLISPVLKAGDFIRHPGFWDEDTPIRFDLIISRLPVGLKGYTEELLKEDEFWYRYKAGFPPRKYADWLIIQHIIASLSSTGRAVIIVPKDAFLRKGPEGEIRLHILKNDLIETMVLLKRPGSSSQEDILLIINHDKHHNKYGKILCIDAAKEQELHILTNLCTDWKEKPNISRIIPLSDIVNHDGVIDIKTLIQGKQYCIQPAAKKWRWELLNRHLHIWFGYPTTITADGVYHVLTPENIDNEGKIHNQTLMRTESLPTGKGRIISSGCIYLVCIQEEGYYRIEKSGIYSGNYGALIGGEGIIWIEIISDEIIPQYLNVLLQIMQKNFRFVGEISSIKKNRISFMIPIPPISIQKKICSMITKDKNLLEFITQMIMMQSMNQEKISLQDEKIIG